MDENTRYEILNLRPTQSYGAIAAKLGISRNSVAGIVFRAEHPGSKGGGNGGRKKEPRVRKLQVVGRSGSLAERFENKTIPEPNSGCLLWLGAVRPGRPIAGGGFQTYGVMRDGKKLVPATHIALRLSGRTVPDGMQALHHCDNPYCVNADHLFIGDQQANVDDMCQKGRHNFYGLLRGTATHSYGCGFIDAQTKIALWMIARGYATGHGDAIEDLLEELVAQVKAGNTRSAA